MKALLLPKLYNKAQTFQQTKQKRIWRGFMTGITQKLVLLMLTAYLLGTRKLKAFHLFFDFEKENNVIYGF